MLAEQTIKLGLNEKILWTVPRDKQGPHMEKKREKKGGSMGGQEIPSLGERRIEYFNWFFTGHRNFSEKDSLLQGMDMYSKHIKREGDTQDNWWDKGDKKQRITDFVINFYKDILNGGWYKYIHPRGENIAVTSRVKNMYPGKGERGGNSAGN